MSKKGAKRPICNKRFGEVIGNTRRIYRCGKKEGHKGDHQWSIFWTDEEAKSFTRYEKVEASDV